MGSAAQILRGVAQVVDGDTLRLGGKTIRLHAMDAPEAGQTCTGADGRPWSCGAAATRELAHLARDGLTCTPRDTDRFGRIVATCTTPRGEDVGAALVRAGLAYAFRRYGLDYVDAEKEALFAGRGVWQGTAERPAQWRARGVAPTSPPPDPACRIKGNISASGRIYHMPGQEHYTRTRISREKGERWFCSEAQARSAGWRRARR